MIPASDPVQRPHDAKLLVIDNAGNLHHVPRSSWIEFLHPGDLVVANDAATIPASLIGVHVASQRAVEVRLAGRRSLDPEDVHEFTAVVFGEGDFHTRTEDRPAPPRLKAGDRLGLGPLSATVARVLDHPRLVAIRFEGSADRIWAGLARHGRPIQYAHLDVSLSLWDVWTPIAGPPVAFEPPSAGFVIDWSIVAALRARSVGFTTITHAAGISSTGDPALDARLPFDEPYRIHEAAASAIGRTRKRGGRVVAVGTTVVRALEHATIMGAIRVGEGLATGRIGRGTRLRAVGAILSGTHEPRTSHYELLRAFADDRILERASHELDLQGYRTHEFGDSVMLETPSQHYDRVRGAD
jgi:S-adenosylmethionine:tRNA ribosyltransferase-isomerase